MRYRRFSRNPQPSIVTFLAICCIHGSVGCAHDADLTDFIEHVSDAPVLLVGWSYGGTVALAAVLARPDLVRRLVLYEPAHGTHIVETDAASRATEDRLRMMEGARESAEQGEELAAVELFIDAVDDMSGAFASLPDAIKRSIVRSAHTLRLMYHASPPEIRAEHLRTLDRPVIVGLGTDTRSFFRLAAEHAVDALPRASLVRIPAARHLWPVRDVEASLRFFREALTATGR